MGQHSPGAGGGELSLLPKLVVSLNYEKSVLFLKIPSSITAIKNPSNLCVCVYVYIWAKSIQTLHVAMPRNHTKLASQRRDENISSCLRVLFVCFLFFKECKFNMHFDSERQSPGSYLFTSGASEQCRLSGTHRITKAFSLNLLWDAVQIWGKSYILFSRT